MMTAERGLKAPLELASPTPNPLQNVVDMVGMGFLRDGSSNPDPLQRIDMLGLAEHQMFTSGNAVLQELAKQVNTYPATRQAVAKMGLSGQFLRQLDKSTHTVTSKKLDASISKQREAQEFQRDHPKPEVKKEDAKKAAPQKNPPAKSSGGRSK